MNEMENLGQDTKSRTDNIERIEWTEMSEWIADQECTIDLFMIHQHWICYVFGVHGIISIKEYLYI